MNKTFAVLYIYDLLNKGVKFQAKDIEEECKCSLRTAKRHIKAVKEYVEKYYPNKVVKYKTIDKSYYLLDK